MIQPLGLIRIIGILGQMISNSVGMIGVGFSVIFVKRMDITFILALNVWRIGNHRLVNAVAGFHILLGIARSLGVSVNALSSDKISVMGVLGIQIHIRQGEMMVDSLGIGEIGSLGIILTT